ncbi:hypothetical protein LPB87_15035 [Flavobacterium sp. EDS]|uniref:hypothetical protein n=1 Tax=Flavobacterium sp. EDS TaxID=2897328 RepID=UPI001E32D325|nr:hypothetical protein [Flavobacterium sp. EDS]MCD0475711.1 hypothetical protein [Flavobacterium sp. EDS]
MATNINTILNWFKTGFKPTQAQFWATWASFWHKDEQIPQNNISGLEIALNDKTDKTQFDDHLSNKKAHANLFDKKANSIHTHEIVDIKDLEKTLDEKALIKHKHEIGDIQGLRSALNEKALITHTHDILDIKELETTLNGKALLSHKHEIVDIRGLESTLDEKALITHTHQTTDIEGLKDQLNTKLTATLATDAETQIDTNASEDKKVISRLKLFNWWEWIKKQPLTLSNKLALATGNTTTPALIIPNGVLTTTPQNGAIERDSAGNLYHVAGSSRYRLLDNRDYNNFLIATWRSTTSQSAFMNSSKNVNFTLTKEAPISSNALGSTERGTYLFKTTDEYLIKNGSHDTGKIPPKEILFEVYLKGNNCTFSGNQYVRLYSILRTDINTYISRNSYEIPLSTGLSLSGGTWYSTLNFSEKSYDNLGNVSSDAYRSYGLRSLDSTKNNLKFSDASLSLEYRVSLIFSDATNSNELNSGAKSSNTNVSTMFLKL